MQTRVQTHDECGHMEVKSSFREGTKKGHQIRQVQALIGRKLPSDAAATSTNTHDRLHVGSCVTLEKRTRTYISTSPFVYDSGQGNFPIKSRFAPEYPLASLCPEFAEIHSSLELEEGHRAMIRPETEKLVTFKS